LFQTLRRPEYSGFLDGLIVTDDKTGNNAYQLFFDIVKYFFL
jgi:hypothetical protein